MVKMEVTKIKKKTKRTHLLQMCRPFDFQEEMKEYCISDVDILQNACCKFRELVKSSTGEKVDIEDVHNLIFKTIYKNSVDPLHS